MALPATHTDETKEQRFEVLISGLASAGYSIEHIGALDASHMFQGRALYPRLHPAGRGESGSTWPAFYGRAYDRITFILAGPQNFGVILPASALAVDFPHYADVFLIGCPGPQYLDAWALGVYNAEGELLELVVADNWPVDFSCPVSPP